MNHDDERTTMELHEPERRAGTIRRPRSAAISAVLALAILFGASLVAAPQASAASNGGVYIVASKSWGWCPNVSGFNNRPLHMHAANFTSGDSRSDSGDDVIWVGVRMNQANRVSVNVGCSLGYYSTGTTITITPRRNGQAFYVAPSGYAWGN